MTTPSAEDTLKTFLAKPFAPWLLTAAGLALIYCNEATLIATSLSDPLPAQKAALAGNLTGKYAVFTLIVAFLLKKTVFASIRPNNFLSVSVGLLIWAIVMTAMPGKDKGKLSSQHASQQESYTQLKSLVVDSVQAQRSAAEEFNAAVNQISSILEPAALADKATVQASLQKVDAYEKAIHTYGDKTAQIKAKAREDILSLPVGEKTKSEFLAGIDNGMKKSMPVIERFKQNQLAVAHKLREVFTFAAETDIQLSSSGEPLFETDAGAARYNGLMDEMAKLGEEEQKIIEELQSLDEASKDTLKMFIK